MSVPINIPQVEALKMSVEMILNEPLQTHNAFISLVGIIECQQNAHISESTLERVWGYSTRHCNAVSLHTLNVLSRFAGADSWVDFCERYKAQTLRESEEIRDERLDTGRLQEGTIVRIGWLPDRLIRIRYLGGNRFVVLSSENSSIQAGDSFSCLHISKGRELFLERFVRDAGNESCYVVGSKHGITILEIEE